MKSSDLDNVYSLIGITLLNIQLTENILKMVTTFVLQDGEVLDITKLTSINKKERKKTLGYFMGKIRERSELFPALDLLMKDFLKNRNDFVHNLSKIPGWDLTTSEGEEKAKTFIVKILRQSNKINEIFASLVIAWQKDVDINIQTPWNDSEVLKEIEEKYGTFTNILFSAKEA